MPQLEDFKVGDVWLTRKDEKVEIVAVCRTKPYPVIGIVDFEHVPLCWTATGKYVAGNLLQQDLVKKVVSKRVVYVNIYEHVCDNGDHASTCPAPTADRADENAAGINRLARVRVEFEEGQFDG